MGQEIRILRSKPTIEGAGVHLKRAFGYHELPQFDPFLLLDDFGSDDPRDYILGFPWHPHRGIETVTYMVSGMVKHEDSIGNKGIIESGDVQWMTAGSGIIHQEMPQQYNGKMRGFQLWVNIPAAHKMMNPRYQEVKKTQIPEVVVNDNVRVKSICGEFNGKQGPVRDIVVETEYFDIILPPGNSFVYPLKNGFRSFVYVYDGRGFLQPERNPVDEEHVAVLHDMKEMRVESGKSGVRFLFVSGKPLGEPVAWYGPIVMNTEEELETAFREYHEGTFIKHR
jgi:redox-sensitive bicupin YhaK (pirin superfamily)